MSFLYQNILTNIRFIVKKKGMRHHPHPLNTQSPSPPFRRVLVPNDTRNLKTYVGYQSIIGLSTLRTQDVLTSQNLNHRS
jgi:hypothetical protein